MTHPFEGLEKNKGIIVFPLSEELLDYPYDELYRALDNDGKHTGFVPFSNMDIIEHTYESAALPKSDEPLKWRVELNSNGDKKSAKLISVDQKGFSEIEWEY